MRTVSSLVVCKKFRLSPTSQAATVSRTVAPTYNQVRTLYLNIQQILTKNKKLKKHNRNFAQRVQQFIFICLLGAKQMSR